MSGKAILILIVGFSTIFLFTGKSFLNVSRNSTINMVENISSSKALEIARSATEVIVSHYWQNPDDVDLIGSSKIFFNNLKFNDGKVTSTIKVDPLDPNMYKITTVASFGDISKTVVVLYGPQKLTEMASYSKYGGDIWWTGDDVVKGAVYCKYDIQVYDHPTFLDKVYSSESDFDYYGDKDDHYPNVDANNLFFGTELNRADNAMDEIMEEAIDGGWYLWGNNSDWDDPSADTMYIEIRGTNMDVKFSEHDSPTTYNIATKVPNKILCAENYVVRLKGELDGQLLIACAGDDERGKGKILLDDDITYKDDPRDGASDDLLGLVADGFIEVADTPENETDIDVHAAIYSCWAGLTAENAQTKADAGKINFFGSLIENERKAVGKFDPDTGELWGYGRNYDYDERLKTISPPGFPELQGFNVLAWYEGKTARQIQNEDDD